MGNPATTPPRWTYALDVLVKAMNVVGAFWVLIIVLLVTADALLRKLWSAPIVGVIEMVELSLGGIVFLQLADAARVRRLTRSFGFLDYLGRIRPVAGNGLRVFHNLVAAVFFFLVIWGTWPDFVDSYVENEFAGDVGVFTAPEWPIKFLVVFGSVIVMLRFLLRALRISMGWEPISEGAGQAAAAGGNTGPVA